MLGVGDEASPGHRSTVPGFDGTLRHLFPELEEGSGDPMEIAERMLELRRRLEEETAGLEEEQPATEPKRRKGWWPFGR